MDNKWVSPSRCSWTLKPQSYIALRRSELQRLMYTSKRLENVTNFEYYKIILIQVSIKSIFCNLTTKLKWLKRIGTAKLRPEQNNLLKSLWSDELEKTYGQKSLLTIMAPCKGFVYENSDMTPNISKKHKPRSIESAIIHIYPQNRWFKVTV